MREREREREPTLSVLLTPSIYQSSICLSIYASIYLYFQPEVAGGSPFQILQHRGQGLSGREPKKGDRGEALTVLE